jgi:pimeloyl-ACP methyl ester carboxylesterase
VQDFSLSLEKTSLGLASCSTKQPLIPNAFTLPRLYPHAYIFSQQEYNSSKGIPIMNTSKQLFTQSFGPDDAPSIVFLHGSGASGWMWKQVISQLPEFHCLAVDLPEQGQSAEIGPFSMKLSAEKVAEVIRTQAHGGKAYVVGLSIGAQTLVQLLSDAPDLVERAIVSSAVLLPVPGLEWTGSPAIVSWSYKMSVPPFRNNDWWIRINMKYSAGMPDECYPEFKREFQALTESGFVNMLVENSKFRMPAGLDKASAPTLVVCGNKEYAAMKQSAKLLATTLPNAKQATLDLGKKSSMASEHNWALTAPKLFAETVRAWAKNAPLPAEFKQA